MRQTYKNTTIKYVWKHLNLHTYRKFKEKDKFDCRVGQLQSAFFPKEKLYKKFLTVFAKFYNKREQTYFHAYNI